MVRYSEDPPIRLGLGHKGSRGVHWVQVQPSGWRKKFRAKFTEESCKCTPRQSVHPPDRARVQFFLGNWGDLYGGSGEFSSFSLRFEGDD